MTENTPTTERVRDLYSWAYAWRTSDDPDEGETDLSQLRADQRAEFDRWLADRDRENRAIGWDEGFVASEQHKDHVAMEGQPWKVTHPANPYRGDTR